jgi:acyl-CoA reductase-like NAD-dependent aldehyde dehydrogenase
MFRDCEAPAKVPQYRGLFTESIGHHVTCTPNRFRAKVTTMPQVDALPVNSPYDGSELARIPISSPAEIDAAVAAAAEAMRDPIPPFERFRVLARTSRMVEERGEEFARTITAEAGKPIRDSRVEVRRAVNAILLCAEEAKRLVGETIPMNATSGAESHFGFTLRVPVGPVCAITPFNAPLNQINHKVPTALAAGCSVVLKPAELTPLSAILLAEVMREAGLPEQWLQLVFGPGETVGAQLLRDERFAAYSFTGSVAVGEEIQRSVGLRKTVLELGNNSPNVVHHDADLDHAAEVLARAPFIYAGQLCISPQRLIAHSSVVAPLLDRLVPRVEQLVMGDPSDEATDVGPMISAAAAERAARVIEQAVAEGAQVRTGGTREGAFLRPTVLDKVTPDMTIAREEVFAPVLAVLTYTSVDEAIELANGTRYGLQAGVFTENLEAAMAFARGIEFGGVMINEASNFRIDQMPFGGTKSSGIGREGIRYAVDEFCESRLVAMRLKPAR